MRLHHLRLTAFQAFAGSEEVDFDALSEAGIFLLHGDTGAGKTTILDAVAFALYGRVPGARASAARLRSDHAAPATRTEVELEVTLRERRLRVVRRPAQQRPKLRGEGFTEEAGACTLQELHDGEWTTLAARRDEADAELADLLGMSCEQFCQVVLLPQGEFATFLRADSASRQAVLERLFATDRFARVESWLSERRKAAGVELRAGLQEVRDVVSRLSEAAAEAPEEGWEEDVKSLRVWADRLGVGAQAEAATSADARAGAARARVAAESALAAGSELVALRSRHAAAVGELSAWEGKRAERDAVEAELAAARHAAPVAALLDRTLQVSADISGIDLQSSPAELRSRAGELRERAGALDALVPVEERLARQDGELQALAAEAEVAQQAADTAARAIAAATERHTLLAADLAAAQQAADRAERLAVEAEAARQRAAKATERDTLTTKRAEAEDRLRQAIDAEQQAHAAWLDLRERRLAGMAAELAADLRPGEPCAVCGAVEHPTPAHLEQQVLPLAAPLAERERAAQEEHATRAEQRAAAERETANVEAALAAAHAIAGDADAAALTADADRLAAELATTRAQAATLADSEGALAALATSIEQHQATRRSTEQQAATARATHAERATLLEADRARIAQARGSAASVAEHAAALRLAADAAEQTASARETAAAAEQAAARAGFPDLATARRAIRDEQAIAALEQQLRAYDAGLAERRALAQDPTLAAAASADPPDLPALQAGAAAAAGQDEDARARDTLAQQRLAAVTRLAAELDDALDVLAPTADSERRIRELAYLVDGSSGANRLHMPLSSYVLAARLEEVAAAASIRLERMSNGRYRLLHSDERARRQRRAGLDLLVVDGWTGRERAPQTLSGGETFLASLALALGLADVVAAEAGGSRLETLFVDEGFGSLDEHTLDEVLDVLDGLREGGRAVGIVSHVPGLRERIPARLHVVKGRSGSRIEQRDAAVAV
ncbi:MAG TPA: AAA family ATPase [Conexibacter sp.]|nr:AAA family ATPase [Conexibacter sp.]